MENGKSKGGSFSGTSFGKGDDVSPGEGMRDGFGLDGGGVLVVEFLAGFY